MKSYLPRLALAASLLIPGLAVAAAPAASAAPADLTTALQQMAAEEKLAHDVYLDLASASGLRQFARIASSESRHLAAIRAAMQRYGVADPTRDDAAGVFDDPTVQRLHDSLVASGEASLAGAAQAGISIERLDIADLQSWIAKDLPADVDRVLSNLLQGSGSHLRAFTSLQAHSG